MEVKLPQAGHRCGLPLLKDPAPWRSHCRARIQRGKKDEVAARTVPLTGSVTGAECYRTELGSDHPSSFLRLGALLLWHLTYESGPKSQGRFQSESISPESHQGNFWKSLQKQEAPQLCSCCSSTGALLPSPLLLCFCDQLPICVLLPWRVLLLSTLGCY